MCADALSPLLITHMPLALVAASPRSMYLVAITHRVPLVLLVPLVTLRLCLTDPVHFELGRRIPMRPRARRFADAIPGIGLLFAVAAWPVSHTLLAAGAGAAPRRRIAAADVVGTLCRVLVLCVVMARMDSVVAAARVASHFAPLACVSFVLYAGAAVGLGRGRRFRRGVRLWLLRRRRTHKARRFNRGIGPAVPAYACQSM